MKSKLFLNGKPPVLVGSILVPTATFEGASHPFSVIKRQLMGAYSCIQRLNEAVDLSPSTLWQFQVLEANKLWKEIAKDKNECHAKNIELIDQNEFFDAHEILLVYHGGEFFECLEESVFEKYESRDIFHLDTVNKNRTVIDCTKGIFGRLSAQISTEDRTDVSPTETSVVRVLEANLAPSDVALSLLVGEMIICLVAHNAGRKWLLTVIFDIGVSLTITHDLKDFVKPPKPLAWPMRLEWFANGTKIEGIEIVAWTFSWKDGTEVQLRLEAYYVPTSNQRILSPQTLLCKEKGIFGSYSGDEENFKLKLSDQAVIVIPYDNRSSLPIIEVLVGPEPAPTVNIAGILDD
jgi:hypothetical protein